MTDNTNNDLLDAINNNQLVLDNDHKELATLFEELPRSTLDLLKSCCSLALASRYVKVSDLQSYFLDFNLAFSWGDEELVQERISELRKSTRSSDWAEASYLELWYKRQREDGMWKESE